MDGVEGYALLRIDGRPAVPAKTNKSLLGCRVPDQAQRKDNCDNYENAE